MSLLIELSTKNFIEASKIEGNKNFKFIVGDKQIFCHKFIAAFLSNFLTRQLISDPTVNSFQIFPYPYFISKEGKHNEEEKEKNIIENYEYEVLSKLVIGQEIEIRNEDISNILEIDNINDKSQLHKFFQTKIYSTLQLAASLNNNELKQQIYERLLQTVFETKEIPKQSTTEITEIKMELNKLKRIENIMKIYGIFEHKNKGTFYKENIREIISKHLSENYEIFIEKISSHFFELDEETTLSLNIEILEEVLKSGSLVVESEDSLLNLLINYQKNQETNQENGTQDNVFLLELIKIEYLSETGIKQFLSEVTLESLNEVIWTNIKKRLLLPLKIDTSSNPRFKSKNKQFSYDSNRPFNGIFQHLTTTTGGNIHTNKTIEISSPNFCCGKLETLVDFNKSDAYIHVAKNQSPYWLQIDFKSRKVKLSGYSIRSVTNCTAHLRSWKIEISNGNGWTNVDEQTNVSELNGYYNVKAFKVDKKHEPFQYIRIISDKNNWANGTGFYLAHLELFGELIE